MCNVVSAFGKVVIQQLSGPAVIFDHEDEGSWPLAATWPRDGCGFVGVRYRNDGILLAKDRKRKEKCAAFSRFALQPNASAMQFDELTRERQTETCSLLLAAIRVIHLNKLSKNAFAILFLDTDAGIAHGELEQPL